MKDRTLYGHAHLADELAVEANLMIFVVDVSGAMQRCEDMIKGRVQATA